MKNKKHKLKATWTHEDLQYLIDGMKWFYENIEKIYLELKNNDK